MTTPGTNTGEFLRAVLRPTNIPAVIAVLVIVVAGVFAERQNRVVFEQRLRAEVLNQVSLIRAKLEGNINGNLQLVRGFVSTIATEPKITQRRFAELAANLFEEDSQLRNIGAAPGLIVSLMYPIKGNEKALGLDYRTNAAQREAALRARDTGELVLAGPVDLVQGGQGFIGRFPVFANNDIGIKTFWGIVSAVIDAERLYADSGLLDATLPIELALTGRDAMGREGVQFFGPAGLMAQNPVIAEVILPSGSWRIAAVPKGGWNARPDNAWLLRLAIMIAGALIVIPMLYAGRLIDERQKHIRELRSREQQLQRLSRRLELALDTSQVGVWEFDMATDDVVWDDRMNEIYGLPTDGGKRNYGHWRDRLHPEDRARAEDEFKAALAAGRYHSEYRMVTPGGEIRNIRAIGVVFKDPDASSKIVGVNWDVSADVALNERLMRAHSLTEARNIELMAAKARIEHNSLHDSLTGLPNRRYLDEILEFHAARCSRTGGSAGLLHIDLDRFKQINDTLGHAAGDAMLVHASEVLKSTIREEDFVARIGGDEFVVVSAPEGGPEELAALADRIIAKMRQPVAYEGHECRFGVSVGIARLVGSEVNARSLLVDADIALYRAKSRGRNRYEFFTEALQAEIIHTKRMADEILSGLEQNQFVAYYQPQFDAKTLDIIGVEALARWKHPRRGTLAPDRFLSIAEELNVVSTIDRMILEQTLQHFEGWRAAGLAVPRVSVNVSSRRLHDEELIKSLRELAIIPGTVSFELVESIYLDESDEIVGWNIDQIKELGIDVEIDDFGTGYASIVSLLKLKPRRLKIDRQLVMPIVGSAAQRHLLESIIDIGHSLGIEVVAEGVETRQHALILRDLGCDALQGYAFAKPMSAEELESFVAAGGWRAAS